MDMEGTAVRVGDILLDLNHSKVSGYPVATLGAVQEVRETGPWAQRHVLFGRVLNDQWWRDGSGEDFWEVSCRDRAEHEPIRTVTLYNMWVVRPVESVTDVTGTDVTVGDLVITTHGPPGVAASLWRRTQAPVSSHTPGVFIVVDPEHEGDPLFTAGVDYLCPDGNHVMSVGGVCAATSSDVAPGDVVLWQHERYPERGWVGQGTVVSWDGDDITVRKPGGGLVTVHQDCVSAAVLVQAG